MLEFQRQHMCAKRGHSGWKTGWGGGVGRGGWLDSLRWGGGGKNKMDGVWESGMDGMVDGGCEEDYKGFWLGD